MASAVKQTPGAGTSPPFVVPQFTLGDYSSFFLAGALCCTLTHGGMTPIDVVKTRIQVDPAFKTHSLLSGTRHIVATEGPAALLTGFGPTAVGYLVQVRLPPEKTPPDLSEYFYVSPYTFSLHPQGGAKFSGYEYWKKQFVSVAGDQETAMAHRTAIYLGASSVAEFFADILLTPLEATRIRLVSERGYASGLVGGFTRLAREEGLRGLYAGFLPILCKQIPYAIGQFTVNEFCHELAYRGLSEEQRLALGHGAQFGIDLGSGVVAGFAAAILSQPADTLLSQINRGHGPTGSMPHRLAMLAREAGFRGLFAGLGPRMVMTAGLVAGQFLLYGAIKKSLNAPPGLEIHKESK